MAAAKLYQLLCNCGWRRITDGSDVGDLYEIKTSPIPKGIPKLDVVKKTTVVQKDRERIRSFRCPECGYIVKPKIINDPQRIMDEKVEKEQAMKEHEENMRQEKMRIAEMQAKDKEQDDKIKKERAIQRKLEAERYLKKNAKKS